MTEDTWGEWALDQRTGTVEIAYVNFWNRSRAKLDKLIAQMGVGVTTVAPQAASTLLTTREPDVVVVGFGAGSRKAATFLADYKSSTWYRRVPLVALVEARDEDMLQLCMEWGCDDALRRPLNQSSLRTRIRLWAMRHRLRQKERAAADRALWEARRAATFSDLIVPLGVAMMAESDFDQLLGMILREARAFCNADGGTLYLLKEDELDFKIMVNDSLNITASARDGESTFPPLPLRSTQPGEPIHMACQVAHTGETIAVDDVYAEPQYDFSGARAFDARTGYRTQSALSIALRDGSGRVVGVLQLINAMAPGTRKTMPFDRFDVELIESMSELAGQAVDSYQRMARLRQQANALAIHIDEEEKRRQVAAITESDYFQNLKAKAQTLRDAPRSTETATSP